MDDNRLCLQISGQELILRSCCVKYAPLLNWCYSHLSPRLPYAVCRRAVRSCIPTQLFQKRIRVCAGRNNTSYFSKVACASKLRIRSWQVSSTAEETMQTRLTRNAPKIWYVSKLLYRRPTLWQWFPTTFSVNRRIRAFKPESMSNSSNRLRTYKSERRRNTMLCSQPAARMALLP